ncbi:MAG: hypothetical protein O3C28_05730 [Proteobacteria bacterium]|nr:hypothetical protein [Pseudomonadota bacterium]
MTQVPQRYHPPASSNSGACAVLRDHDGKITGTCLIVPSIQAVSGAALFRAKVDGYHSGRVAKAAKLSTIRAFETENVARA